MLSIKEILAVKSVFILAVNYDAGSIGEMAGEDRDLNLYLAEMTIQYHSLVDNACLAFTVECLVRFNNNAVTIEEMNTNNDYQVVYAHNIDGLPDDSHQVWTHDIDDELQNVLLNLIENQPIYDAPNNFIIEAY